MRLDRLAVLPLLALAAGCIRMESVVKVKADGSGQLVETVTMSPKTAAMLEGVRRMGEAGQKADAETGPFSVTEARAKAARLGAGVTFVSATPLETPHGKGLTVTYAFSDVSKLRIAQTGEPPSATGPSPAGASEDKFQFRFSRQGGSSVLTVMPVRAPGDPGDREPASPRGGAARPAPSGEDLAMMREMFQGLRLAVVVEVEGRIVKTNSPHVEGSRVTLLDLDFDQLLRDEAAFGRLSAAQGESLESAKAWLKDVKGIKVNLDPEVRIEFAPK